MMKRIILSVVALIFLTLQALSVEPNEILDDPVLESRARDISKGLRCMQCQNETIDESSADIARDLRLAVRERLVAGDTDEETVAYIVDRYGEFALLSPTKTGANLLLWFAGPIMFLLAIFVGMSFIRRSSAREKDVALSDAEKDRLGKILGQNE